MLYMILWPLLLYDNSIEHYSEMLDFVGLKEELAALSEMFYKAEIIVSVI